MLGPVLFLIYINDITTNIHSQLSLFADDCLVYHPINSSEDHKVFQDDLRSGRHAKPPLHPIPGNRPFQVLGGILWTCQ